MEAEKQAPDWRLRHRFSFEGREVRWDSIGAGAPVVLVHGTPWSSYNLRHLIRDLSGRYRVFYYDMLGYGQSEKSEGDVSLGIQNRVLDQLLDHWGLREPIVMGHDFGGATALRTHLLQGRSFKQLILIDAVALSPWGSPFFRHVRAHQAAFSGLPAFIHRAVVKAYVQTAAHHPLPDETLQGILAPWTGEAGQAAFYRQIVQADARYTDEVEERYASMAVPTLILWGEADEWIPVQKGRELHARLRGSKLHIIPDAGHLVIEENPRALLEAIRSFLATEPTL